MEGFALLRYWTTTGQKVLKRIMLFSCVWVVIKYNLLFFKVIAIHYEIIGSPPILKTLQRTLHFLWALGVKEKIFYRFDFRFLLSFF